MRVISGKFRSRPLQSLRGMETRPTADRLRETLFNVLAAGDSGALQDSVWLDLYAGTGAVGIEALSRGAGKVYFIDSSPKAVATIRQNLRSLGIRDGFEVQQREVMRALRLLDAALSNSEAALRPARGGPEATVATVSACDFVFLDPPYRERQAYAETLSFLATSPLLTPQTQVIAEHERRFDPTDRLGGLHRFRLLEQGDAALSFYRTEVPKPSGPR
jgi:16S rRNA (guanine(966)-N(2))-methyltransferase RsmD